LRREGNSFTDFWKYQSVWEGSYIFHPVVVVFWFLPQPQGELEGESFLAVSLVE
jgi:hypothetical protein